MIIDVNQTVSKKKNQFEIIYNGEKNRKPDIAYFSDCPGNMLISEKAYDCLKDILDLEDIELLRTKYKETKYLLIQWSKAWWMTMFIFLIKTPKYNINLV